MLFFASVEIIMIFILHYVNMIDSIYQFAYVKQFLPPRNKSYLIMVYDSFNVLLNLVFCLRLAAFMFIKDIGL